MATKQNLVDSIIEAAHTLRNESLSEEALDVMIKMDADLWELVEAVQDGDI